MEKEDYLTEGRGRSAKKREAQEITRLAEKLMTLPETELPALPLAAELRADLIQARQTKGHSSRKRALKHFAGLLRRDDDARKNLIEAMAQIDTKHGQETVVQHDLEQLRERLCSDDGQDAALQEVEIKFPSVDRNVLLRLIKSARQGKDKRAYREIFRRLRDAQE